MSDEKKRLITLDIDEFKEALNLRICESDPGYSFQREKMFELSEPVDGQTEDHFELTYAGIDEIVDASMSILEDIYFDQSNGAANFEG